MSGIKAQHQEITKKETAFQALKFGLFSVSAGIIELLSFTAMNELTNLPYWPCYLTALVISVLYNFTVNRRYTFKSANNVPIAMFKILCFYLVFTPISTYLGHLADKNEINEYIILGITMAFNLCLEFLYCRFFVYRGTINTNKLAKKNDQEKTDSEKEND